jgi:hypothetical protein
MKYISHFPYVFYYIMFYTLSIYFLEFYSDGDLIDYDGAYEALYNQALLPSGLIYRGLIGSYEPIHFFFTWISSNLDIPREHFLAFWNANLATLFLRVGSNLNASRIVLVLLLFTNLYFLALYTELERLKFAFVFFFASLLCVRSNKLQIFFSILCLLSHLQFLVVYAGILLLHIEQDIRRLLQTGCIRKVLVWYVALIPIIVLPLSGHLGAKLAYYYDGIYFLHLIKVAPFVFLIWYYSRDIVKTTLLMLPVLAAIALVGGDRLIIFAYFIFLFFASQRSSGLNVGVLITSLYFSYTGLDFILNVFTTGRGYAP